MILVALGHSFRRDDGVGPALLKAFPGCEGYHSQGDPLGLMLALQDHQRAVVVDCMEGASPGRIHRWVWGQNPPEQYSPKLSSHTLPLFSILELLEKTGKLPREVVIYALEGQDFGWGEGFSGPVEAAIPELTTRLARELEHLDQYQNRCQSVKVEARNDGHDT